MSMSKIISHDGCLVWDNFPVSLKYWMIEWDKTDDGLDLKTTLPASHQRFGSISS